MRSPTQMILWLSFFSIALGLGHFYLYSRLVRAPQLPKRPRRALLIFFSGALLSQIAIMPLARSLPRDSVTGFAFAAFLWMGLLSTLFSLLVLVDFGRLLAWLFTSKKHLDEPRNPDRRVVLARALSGGVAAGGFALTGASVAHALGAFRLAPVDVELEKLPPEFDGFRVVQISDIHVGPTIGRDFIEHLVTTVNGLRPDLIAITGDLVDGSVAHLAEHTAPLATLEAPHGTYFVTGNHEYYSGVEDWIRELARLGIPTLRNERVSIERQNATFDLAGVTDHRAEAYDDAPDFDKALRGRDPNRELILLAHQPAALYDAQKHDVGLQLSGHTHGGQFWPWNWIVRLVQPVAAGWARFGRTQVYVNTGTGYWGPPLRLGTDPEITIVTLRSKKAREPLGTS